MTSLGFPGLSSQSVSDFLSLFRPESPETDWGEAWASQAAESGQKTWKRTGMTSREPRLVIAVRFGVFWPKRTNKTRNGLGQQQGQQQHWHQQQQRQQQQHHEQRQEWEAQRNLLSNVMAQSSGLCSSPASALFTQQLHTFNHEWQPYDQQLLAECRNKQHGDWSRTQCHLRMRLQQLSVMPHRSRGRLRWN